MEDVLQSPALGPNMHLITDEAKADPPTPLMRLQREVGGERTVRCRDGKKQRETETKKVQPREQRDRSEEEVSYMGQVAAHVHPANE